MSTREALLAHLDAAYGDLLTVVGGLDEHHFEEKWLDGRWGVREIVAHIAGWLGQLGGGLERMSRGEKPAPEGVDWTDVQTWNDTFARHAMGKRQAEVLSELEHAVQAFKDSAQRVPADRFGEGKTANKMFDAAGAPHLREHAEMVRRWRESRGLAG